MNEIDWDNFIRENLRYEPDTGNLYWTNVGIGNMKRNMYKPAGGINNKGYFKLNLKIYGMRKTVQNHRIAWFLYYGKWPDNMIDHINGIRTDNRIVNLREATNSQNQFNRGADKDSTSKYKGVSLNKRNNKWKSGITVNTKIIHLGYFHNEHLAALAYNKAAIKLHGEFAYLNVIEDQLELA